jgi:KaiC/GvpD/RAD55 family RecA-like ATPase
VTDSEEAVQGVEVPSFDKPRKKGLLKKAEGVKKGQDAAADDIVKARAAELTIETPQEAREERSEVPAAFDMAAIKEAIESRLKRREGPSEISLETGNVIPGTETGEARRKDSVIERVPSGIPGLDSQTEGGFVKRSINLVTGSPGAGKTIFAAQFIISGIEQHQEPGLYISFEEKKENFLKYMKQFGWDFEKHEKTNKFAFLRYSPEQVHKLLTEGGGLVDTLVRKLGVKRICIDSISAFTLLFKDELSARESLLGLFEMIEGWGATTLLTAEQEAEPERHEPSVVEFEVDSVISLYNFRKKNIRQRVAEIIKMRGTRFAQKVFPIKIGDDGMVFYPEEAAF